MSDTAEKQRIAELLSYQIMDTETSRDFDELVELASEIAGTPISLLTLIDEERQWFKAKKGITISGTSRELSFCSHAIDSGQDWFMISDTTLDERFATNDLVISDPFIRFYAGFPLVTERGFKLGTLCVIDKEPRTLLEDQIHKLQRLANQAMKLIELHKAYNQLQVLGMAEKKHKASLERLLENQRMIISILAHDTRAPLYSMKELLDMLAKGLIPAEQLATLTGMMSAQTEVTIQMIENLVKWAGIHLNPDESRGTTSAQRQIVEDVFRQYGPAAKAKGILLHNEVRDSVRIGISTDVLSFLIRNLVNNSIKFTESGVVVVRGGDMNGRYELSVADTGVGIAEQMVKALFSARPTSTYGTRKEQGSGLGLLLVNEFVQQAGGRIEVESVPQLGTTVRISIPLAAGNAPR